MVRKIRTKYEYVVEIDNDELANKWSQGLIHNPHKRAWSIRQTKRHNKPFKKTFSSFKSCFPLITWTDSYLMIATLKIKFREDRHCAYLIEQVIKVWYWKTVTYCDLLNGVTIQWRRWYCQEEYNLSGSSHTSFKCRTVEQENRVW